MTLTDDAATPATGSTAPTGETQMDIANRDEDIDEQDPTQDELRVQLAKYSWNKPTDECIQDLISRSNDYYQYILATGKMALWRLCFEQYNRGYITLGSMSRGGTEGELLNLPINEFRNLVDHVVGLTTQDKLAFEPQPVNNDYTTAAQVTLAKGILNDYAKNKGFDEICTRAANGTYIFGEYSIIKLFNENLGDMKMIDPTNQKIYRKGEFQFLEVNPSNLIRDVHCPQFKDNQWFIARIYVNKYDLAAQYPDKAKEICEKTIASDWDNTHITSIRAEKSDLVPLFLGFHKKTSSLPFGRQIFYLDSDTWLEDSHLQYREFPVYTNMPAPVESINHGYTTAFDLLPMQQILDTIDSGHATNLSNFLVSNILVPDGCNLGVADLIGSMNLLKYTPAAGRPEPLNLVLFPKESMAFREFIVQRMEVLAGINGTTRGQPDEKITSGTMAALYASQAIHFNSKFQKSYSFFVGSLASGLLYDLQDHPEDQRTGLVAGKGNRSYLKEFYGKDVNMIDRVLVSVGSPFSQTDAGKIQMAQDLLNGPNGLDNKEYLEVVETGSLEPLIEGPHREMMLIKGENEALSEGSPAKAVLTDDHVTHIKEHKNVIADPGLRLSNDPKAATIVNNTLTHIAEHEQLMQQLGATRPLLAGILGQPVPQPPGALQPGQHPAQPPHPQQLPPGRAPQKPGQPPQQQPQQKQVVLRPPPKQKVNASGAPGGAVNIPNGPTLTPPTAAQGVHR